WADSPYIEEKLYFAYISDRFQALKASLLYPLFTLATGSEAKKEAITPLLESVYFLSTVPRFLLGLETYGAIGLTSSLISRAKAQITAALLVQKKKLSILRDVKVSKFEELSTRLQKWQDKVLESLLLDITAHTSNK